MLPIEKQIRTREQLNACLEYEKAYYPCNVVASLLLITERSILRRHQILLRKTEYYLNTQHVLLGTLYRTRLVKMQNRFLLHIPLNCCEPGLHIMHLGPILINSNAQLGKRCSLHINTAIVANGINGDAPILGNNVVVGVGAVILGGITVANNTAIGANAVVNKSVIEENIAVAGVPAKKVSNNGRLNWKKNRSDSGGRL